MATIALKRKVFGKSRRRIPVWNRVAKYVQNIYTEYEPEKAGKMHENVDCQPFWVYAKMRYLSFCAMTNA